MHQLCLQASPSVWQSGGCVPSHWQRMLGLVWSGQVMPSASVASSSSHRLDLSWPSCKFGYPWALGWTCPCCATPVAGGAQGPESPSQAPLSYPLFICQLNPFSKLCRLLNGPFDMSELRVIPRWALSCPFLFFNYKETINSQDIPSCILMHHSFYWEENSFSANYYKDKHRVYINI